MAWPNSSRLRVFAVRAPQSIAPSCDGTVVLGDRYGSGAVLSECRLCVTGLAEAQRAQL